MNNQQSDAEETQRKLVENDRYKNDEGLFKREGEKSLIVDKDGFVTEVGENRWRRYDSESDKPTRF